MRLDCHFPVSFIFPCKVFFTKACLEEVGGGHCWKWSNLCKGRMKHVMVSGHNLKKMKIYPPPPTNSCIYTSWSISFKFFLSLGSLAVLNTLWRECKKPITLSGLWMTSAMYSSRRGGGQVQSTPTAQFWTSSLTLMSPQLHRGTAGKTSWQTWNIPNAEWGTVSGHGR